MRTLAILTVTLLAACAGDPAAPTVPVPTIPAPVLDAQSCYNLNLNVYKIEEGKRATGHYGEGEEERLETLRRAAALMGCYLDPDFVPAPVAPPAEDVPAPVEPPVVVEPAA